jgi:hypothetical protein
MEGDGGREVPVIPDPAAYRGGIREWIHAQPRRRRSTAKVGNQSSTRSVAEKYDRTSGSRFDILANSDLER